MSVRILMMVFAMLFSNSASMALESNEIDYGDYTVYYNVFPSDALLPKIAKATGIRRAESRLVLTMVVKDNTVERQDDSVRADISGHIMNVYGQVRQIKPREVNDQGVIYYLYDFAAANGERLKFSVDITPTGEDQPLELEFSR